MFLLLLLNLCIIYNNIILLTNWHLNYIGNYSNADKIPKCEESTHGTIGLLNNLHYIQYYVYYFSISWNTFNNAFILLLV